MAATLVKRVAQALAGDYSIYRIYASRVTEVSVPISKAGTSLTVVKSSADVVGAQPSSLINEQAGYGGTGTDVFICRNSEKIVGVCCYWSGDRYRERNFWPLKKDEAKLVQIVVEPDQHGAGVAPTLITQSCNEMLRAGISRCYARIWHSNTPSIRAFEKAGWGHIATVIEVLPFGLARRCRIVIPALRRHRAGLISGAPSGLKSTH